MKKLIFTLIFCLVAGYALASDREWLDNEYTTQIDNYEYCVWFSQPGPFGPGVRGKVMYEYMKIDAVFGPAWEGPFELCDYHQRELEDNIEMRGMDLEIQVMSDGIKFIRPAKKVMKLELKE